MENISRKNLTTGASPSTRIRPIDAELANSVDAFTTGGDTQVVAGLYKSRKNHNRKKCCKYTPQGIAKCWAYTNLVRFFKRFNFKNY